MGYKIIKLLERKAKEIQLKFLKAKTKIRRYKIAAENWLKQIIRRGTRSFLFIPFCVFLGALILVTLATLLFRQEKYGGNFIEGILIEAHGLLLEILVVSIILYAFQKNMEKKSEIKKYKEEIQCAGAFTSEQMEVRIIANIKKLNELGVTNINLSNFNITDSELDKIDLRGAILRRTNLEKSRLYEVLLQAANLKAAILTGTCLYETKLQKADLTGARLENAIFSFVNLESGILIGTKLEGCEFIKSDLQKADFQGANLKGAVLIDCNLKKARNLTMKQLQRTSSLYKTRLDDRLMRQVEKECRELLEPPRFKKIENKA